jgi:hypothetical protein
MDRRGGFAGKQVENLVPREDTSGRPELNKVVCQKLRNKGAIPTHRGIKQGLFRPAQLVGDVFCAGHLLLRLGF